MSNDVEQISEQKLRKKAERKIQYRKSVKIHFSLFLIGNFLIFVINFLFNPFVIDGVIEWQKMFFLYPLFGWLIGIMMHLTAYILFANAVEPLGKRMIIFHIVAFIFVNILLALINYINTPDIMWVGFPLIFWGAGLIAHIVLYFVYFSEPTPQKSVGKSKKEQAIEKEMQKMREQMDTEK